MGPRWWSCANFDPGQHRRGAAAYAAAMFKHILIPTDGSEVAAKAIRAGVRLAAEMGAKVTGLYAQEPHPMHLHAGGYAVEKDLIAELDRRARLFAQNCVAQVATEAAAAGVACEPLVVRSDRPYEAIVKTAQERGCDAIFMASHGHKGLAAMVLGSVTQQVLARASIPVLVFR
jgi:nucleotide-binding universal stress UspA family protein